MTKALSQAKTCAKAFVRLKEKIKQNLKESPKIKDSWEIRKGSFKEKSKKNFILAGEVYCRNWIWERRKNKKKKNWEDPSEGRWRRKWRGENEKWNYEKSAKRWCEGTKVNPYKACIYRLCRDFLDADGYDLGTNCSYSFFIDSFAIVLLGAIPVYSPISSTVGCITIPFSSNFFTDNPINKFWFLYDNKIS